jgi:hypothetical protein
MPSTPICRSMSRVILSLGPNQRHVFSILFYFLRPFQVSVFYYSIQFSDTVGTPGLGVRHPDGKPSGWIQIPDGNHPDGNHPDGNHPDGNHPDGNHPDGNHPDGNHPDGNHPDGNHRMDSNSGWENDYRRDDRSGRPSAGWVQSTKSILNPIHENDFL